MCLCNGTGGIHIKHSWGIQFEPCPDTTCQFDKEKADRAYNDWKKKWEEHVNGTGRRNETRAV